MSSVTTRYQLGLDFHAGPLIVPLSAPTRPRDLRVRHERGLVRLDVGEHNATMRARFSLWRMA
jgi:hypothetical protein